MTVAELQALGYKVVYVPHEGEYQACDPQGLRIKSARSLATGWEVCRKHAKANKK